jgi:ribonucleoside-diphosphate reductase alpha chain
VKRNFHGIVIDDTRDIRLSTIAQDLLGGFYRESGEGFQEVFALPALAFCEGDLKLAQDIYDDVSKGWAMFSSPIMSNAPAPGKSPKAMPISCFLTYVPDTREGLVDHQAELAWLSMMGGGVGGHWDNVRAVSEKSVGPIPHIKIADSAIEGFRQGKTRKGSYASYLSVSHPDILEYLAIRLPTGGDINRKCFNIHHAVNIPDDFMDAVRTGKSWELRCPSSGEARETIGARELWQSILETRARTGEPYLNFIDTANRALPEALKARGLKIHGSNLCNEIHLPTSPERSAVCCLSSVNLELWEEWRLDRSFIKRWVRFLDNVLTFFIRHCPDTMAKAKVSAEGERSIGLGAMGFHSLLQSKGIAWETPMAEGLNRRISEHIHTQAIQATLELGEELGEAPDMAGTGRRNAHVLAIAPNANSGLICGTSPSIEPLRSNLFTQRTRAGSHVISNPHLEKILEQVYGPDEMPSVWASILEKQGSVQHLTELDEQTRDVFKTAPEVDQLWVVHHAAIRQKFVCQGQSVNLYFPFGADRAYFNKVHLSAFQKGLKGLYYLRTDAGFTGDQVSKKVERVALKDFNAEDDGCLSCQG